MTMASLARMVRDQRTVQVHLPHEEVSVMRITENLGRTLFKIRWETGGESVLLVEDLESWPHSRLHGGETPVIRQSGFVHSPARGQGSVSSRTRTGL